MLLPEVGVARIVFRDDGVISKSGDLELNNPLSIGDLEVSELVGENRQKLCSDDSLTTTSLSPSPSPRGESSQLTEASSSRQCHSRCPLVLELRHALRSPDGEEIHLIEAPAIGGGEAVSREREADMSPPSPPMVRMPLGRHFLRSWTPATTYPAAKQTGVGSKFEPLAISGEIEDWIGGIVFELGVVEASNKPICGLDPETVFSGDANSPEKTPLLLGLGLGKGF